MTKRHQGFGHMSDHERAKLRGKGQAPDYPPGSVEGTRLTEEPGLSGDTTSLRGHTTGGLTPKNPELTDDLQHRKEW